MIIEAGYDLHMLFNLELSRSKCDTGIWTIAMDENLTLCSLKRVRGADPTMLASDLGKIAKAIRKAGIGNARYFAVAALDRTRIAAEADFSLQEDLIRTAVALADFQLLGTCLFDVEGQYSSIPRYSFRDYPSLADLPRSGTWSGPHAVDCDCPACVSFNERLRRNRERYELERGTANP